MNDRFLVPTAVAAALHAFVLFGFPRAFPPVGTASGLSAVIADPPPKDEIELILPRPPDESDSTPMPKGEPDKARIDPPEAPPTDPNPRITFPKDPPSVPSARPPTKFATGPIGDPNGLTGIDTGGLVSSGHLDNVPRTRSQLAPVYPYEARKAGRPGEVVVEFVVDEAGHVLDPHVLHSNDPIFDAPTLRAVSKWRFEPGRKNGRIVRFRMAVPVAFAINP